ncbi:tRNA (adenosine(37)-N6)-threonylcarbamoyltransferase complex transferase subunit TsaD [Candidatus Woesearchaeota archaeon]|nr:tRNA (adenosine(37)-N6)-threonylcarbamoyltransferase complex transferase subunit TsaD [Candidatus Woesearchaeota archaeon]
MICLGVESTAHTFGIGIIDNKGNILANVKDMYMTEKGGIIPIEAKKHHESIKEELLENALKEAKLTVEDIDIISFSSGPGLAPCLVVGKNFAKELALKCKKPLIGVNHLIAHLEIGKVLTKVKDPVFILATGANTQIIAFEGRKYRIFGEALSIGIGNALDKFGRNTGLGFPCGPEIEKLAKKGRYVELSYVVKGMDVEFSGIVTQAINFYKKGISKEDLCFSLQETLFAMLTEVSERALAHTEKKELLLIGGVAANRRLITMLKTMCKDRMVKFSVVPVEYSGDQGLMIAWQGILEYKRNKKYYNNLDIKKVDINSNWRIDD